MTSSLLVDWPQVDAYLKLTEAPGERLLMLFPPKKGGGGGMHFPITDGVIPKDEVETVLRKNPTTASASWLTQPCRNRRIGGPSLNTSPIMGGSRFGVPAMPTSTAAG